VARRHRPEPTPIQRHYRTRQPYKGLHLSTADRPTAGLPSLVNIQSARVVNIRPAPTRNASLGRAGEEFALAYERARLHALGKKALSDRVEHVAETKGDGLGFDVLSFEETGRERFIEVKTTSFAKEKPFFISRNEVEFSKLFAKQFQLYRLFEFRKLPRMFSLSGAIGDNCIIDPVIYAGRFS
jgi:hypothetical protein